MSSQQLHHEGYIVSLNGNVCHMQLVQPFLPVPTLVACIASCLNVIDFKLNSYSADSGHESWHALSTDGRKYPECHIASANVCLFGSFGQ